jgi:hypothetical protein
MFSTSPLINSRYASALRRDPSSPMSCPMEKSIASPAPIQPSLSMSANTESMVSLNTLITRNSTSTTHLHTTNRMKNSTITQSAPSLTSSSIQASSRSSPTGKLALEKRSPCRVCRNLPLRISLIKAFITSKSRSVIIQ